MKIKLVILLSLVTYNLQAQFLNAKFKCVAVRDCDSFSAVDLRTGNVIEVRMSCIDAPEKEQSYYKESKAYLDRLILGKNIELKSNSFDMYGRAISEVYLNNLNINLHLVQTGNAFVYDKYCRNQQFYNAENKAKSLRLGVWKINGLTRPWDFRKFKAYKA